MITASSIRSAWEKLSVITCCALVESGLVVMLPSEVNADPRRVPMARTEAARTRTHALTARQGWTAQTRARCWVTDARPEGVGASARSLECVTDISLVLS